MQCATGIERSTQKLVPTLLLDNTVHLVVDRPVTIVCEKSPTVRSAGAVGNLLLLLAVTAGRDESAKDAGWLPFRESWAENTV